MPHSNSTMLLKLKRAINQLDENKKIVINQEEWYSPQKDTNLITYIIKMTKYNPEKDKFLDHKTLYKTTSKIQVVLFLRDYLFIKQGKKCPEDNAQWIAIKKERGVEDIILNAINS